MTKRNILIPLLTAGIMLLIPLLGYAQTTEPKKDVGASTPKISNPLDNPVLTVSIPGFAGFRNPSCDENGQCSVPWLADYIQGLYKYGITIICIMAVIGIMIGGTLWLTAAGNEERAGDAKKWIGGSLFGVLLAVTSYMVLNLVNPALTELSPIKVSSVAREDLPDISEYEALIENNGELPPLANLPPAMGNIVTVKVETLTGEKSVQVDKSIAEMLKKTMKEVKDKGFKIYEIGGYRVSKMCHGVGLAVDINVKDNYCVDCYKSRGEKVGSYYRPAGPGASGDYSVSATSFNQEIVNVFKRNGWCWGGDWKSFKDYMHFSTPSCRKGVECGAPGLYNFSESVKANHKRFGITYP